MKGLLTTFIAFIFFSTAIAGEDSTINMSEAVKTGNVVVKPSIEYIVDLAGYKVPEEAKLLILHVMDSPMSHYYYQEIQRGTAIYKMNADTLKATTGSPSFKGFKEGDGAFLIIGSEVQPGSINMGMLYSKESISVIVRD